jgi:hypothetical protein
MTKREIDEIFNNLLFLKFSSNPHLDLRNFHEQ